jgi:hypothetical protein
MPSSRPRQRNARQAKIFIASSSENKSITAVLESCLKLHADITPWYLDSVWGPGNFILQTLLEQASTYDFAVIVFGRDDKVISRGAEQYSPRDNVIFEAGLFMAHLGHKRTFIVAPNQNDLKILSDLAGLVVLTYAPPDEINGLQGALKHVCKKICDEIKVQKTRRPSVAAKSWLADFGHAHFEVNNLLALSNESKEPIEVLNIALDMEYTWSLILRDNVVKHRWPRGLKWQSLMVDPRSEDLKQISSGDLSLDIARQREQEIVDYCRENKQALQSKNIVFECRAYSDVPVLHGFLVGADLHIGFCSAEDGALSCTPYLSFIGDSGDINLNGEIATNYIKQFRSLFRQRWNAARKIWPQ